MFVRYMSKFHEIARKVVWKVMKEDVFALLSQVADSSEGEQELEERVIGECVSS
jgi:hypothetical protein